MGPFTVAAGGLTVATGVLAAAASGGEAATNIAPWLQGGGSAAAVAGLVYVARLIVRGDLVPSAVSAREAETGAAIRASFERETRMQELIEQAHDREKALRVLNDASIATLTKLQGELQQVQDELRYWRERRDQNTRRAP